MRNRLFTALKLLISLGLIWWVFSRIPLAEVGAQLAAARLALVLAALAAYLLAMALNAVKWQVLLRAQDVRIPFGPVLEFQFIGFFFNNFLPSSSLGGDVMRGYGLARYTDRTAAAAASVIVDRIVGLLAYMVSAAVAALLAVTWGGYAQLEGMERLAFAVVLVLVIGLAALLSRRLRGLASRLLAWRPLSPLAPAWERLSAAFGSYRFRYRALALSFAVALLGIVCTTLVNWLVSRSMGGAMSLFSILLFSPLISLVMIIPISIGGLGLSQSAYPFFFAMVGVPPEHAVAVSLLIQVLALVASLPGGLFWLRSRRSS